MLQKLFVMSKCLDLLYVCDVNSINTTAADTAECLQIITYFQIESKQHLFSTL